MLSIICAAALLWAPILSPGRAPSRAARAPIPTGQVVEDVVDFDALGESSEFTAPVGVLLLSVGSPVNPEDVEEYLYNVFRDPEILTLPQPLSFLKKPLAWGISKARAGDARRQMIEAGGVSPTQLTIQEQADALEQALAERGCRAKLFLAMRYWYPFAGDAVQQMKAQNITKLVILPLYPQVINTRGSGRGVAAASGP